jgi:hypothetical protein
MALASALQRALAAAAEHPSAIAAGCICSRAATQQPAGVASERPGMMPHIHLCASTYSIRCAARTRGAPGWAYAPHVPTLNRC